ncbi:MAG: DEAD/DEAH box helicase family protein [Verrucomicrobiota bacterium]
MESIQDEIRSLKEALFENSAQRKDLLAELRKLEFHRTHTLEPHLAFETKEMPKTAEDKIALFEQRFVARKDLYPQLWENPQTGRKGYSPVYERIREDGHYLKPTEIYKRYGVSKFKRLDQDVLRRHLMGTITVGTYSIRPDDTCIFLACDFDKANWKEDSNSYRDACNSFGIEPLIEISRSGTGCHAWIFFANPVKAELARRLGNLVLSKATALNPDLRLDSYDRFFPNQDFMPKGGFGNLIALPLQMKRREQDCTVFVDEDFKPYQDQWEVLAKADVLYPWSIQEVIDKNIGDLTDKEITSLEADELALELSREDYLSTSYKSESTIIQLSQLVIPTANLPKAIIGKLKSLATFPNPVFYEKQKQRFSTYKIPKYIFSGELHPDKIILPRGCLDDAISCFELSGSRPEIDDRRVLPKGIRIRLIGELQPKQKSAIKDLKAHDIGILSAPPGSGKTVMACAMMAFWKKPVLILVHRQNLLDQWVERLTSFLDLEKNEIGVWKGSKKKMQNKVDIAMMQTLISSDSAGSLFKNYGALVIDECHHVPAVSFEALLKQCSCRFILGLTATPKRKDRLEKILYQQCGPIRHSFDLQATDHVRKIVYMRETGVPHEASADLLLHKVWETLINLEAKNELIVEDILGQIEENRVIIVLSDRKSHLDLLHNQLIQSLQHPCNIAHPQGGMGKKDYRQQMKLIESAIQSNSSLCIFSTSALIGEGFDLPGLDTLFLATPISFKGRLIQYAGRLNRISDGKSEIRIFDYVDENLPLTLSMYRKRRAGYKELGYEVVT